MPKKKADSNQQPIKNNNGRKVDLQKAIDEHPPQANHKGLGKPYDNNKDYVVGY